MKHALAALLLLFGGTGVAHCQTTTRYSNPYYGFAFDYPTDWSPMAYPGEVILVREPLSEVLSNPATFDVTADTLKQDLDSYCDTYEATLRSGGVFKELNILSKEKISFHGAPAIEYHCTATAADLPMEWKSVVLSHQGRTLKISTASLVGFYDIKKEMTDKIFDSFRLQ